MFMRRSFCLFWISLLVLGTGPACTQNPSGAVLQGVIEIEPQRPQNEKNKIQPGTAINLKMIIENKGNSESAPGQAYIRFGFAHPLEKQPKSIIFETEKMELPSIEPGKKYIVTFKTSHAWPTLLDFVRQDWSLREYQGMVVIDDQEKMIGTLVLTVSAYYYPGVNKEFPVEVESLKQESLK